jgi:phosphoribosylcarboxyaminoimidazole (NCAIR) mutase
VALAASQEVLNRVFGKPLQSVDSEMSLRTMPRGIPSGQMACAASHTAACLGGSVAGTAGPATVST